MKEADKLIALISEIKGKMDFAFPSIEHSIEVCHKRIDTAQVKTENLDSRLQNLEVRVAIISAGTGFISAIVTNWLLKILNLGG